MAEVGAYRVMLGTDHPIPGLTSGRSRHGDEDLSAEEKAEFVSGNAGEILGMELVDSGQASRIPFIRRHRKMQCIKYLYTMCMRILAHESFRNRTRSFGGIGNAGGSSTRRCVAAQTSRENARSNARHTVLQSFGCGRQTEGGARLAAAAAVVAGRVTFFFAASSRAFSWLPVSAAPGRDP